MKIKITLEIELDDEVFGTGEDEKLWLENEILIANDDLFLHSNEIGDVVGKITKVSNLQYVS
jgi:hypothetical protein